MHPAVRILIPAASLALMLSACASTPPGPSRATAEREQRRADCEARGGMLIPSGRPISGRDELDYVCRIQNASLLPSN